MLIVTTIFKYPSNFDSSMYQEILQKLNLNTNEAKVYEALLSLGLLGVFRKKRFEKGVYDQPQRVTKDLTFRR